MPSPHRSIAGRLTSLIALPVLLLGLASCSAGDAPAPSSAPSETTAGSFESWQLQFAQCMRDAGIDFEDPDPNGGGRQAMQTDSATADASEACMEKLGPPPAGSEKEGSAGDSGKSMLDMAKCLRKEGFDVDDPTKSSGLSLPDGVPAETLKKCGLPDGVSGGSIISTN